MIKRFFVLDAFRGLAAIFVFLLHMPKSTILTDNSFINNSAIFVDLFFVLSGFVIYHNYKFRLTSFIKVKSFLIKRVLRLVPLHIYTLSIILILEIIKLLIYDSLPFAEKPFQRNTISSFWSQLFLLNSTPLSLSNSNNWNGPNWSVSAEFVAYFMFAFTSLLWKYKDKFISFYAISIICLGYLFYYLKYDHFNLISSINLGFVRGVTGFFVGVLTYEVWNKLAHVWHSINENIFKTLEFISIILVVFLIINAQYFINYFFVYHIAFGLLIFVYSFEKGLLSVLFKLNIFQKLGLWSYSIYLNHLFLIIIFSMLFNKLSVVKSNYTIVFEILLLIILCFYSSKTYKYIESRFYRHSKKS